MRRTAPLAFVWALLALALGAAATSAAPPAHLPDGPDLAAMALGPKDFARARVVAQGHQEPDGAVALYAREFGTGSRARRTPLLSASSEVALLADEVEARSELAAMRQALASAAGRAQLARSFRSSFTQSAGGLRVTKVAVSRPATLGIGVDTLRFGITFTAARTRFHLVLAFVRVDRAVGTIVLFAQPGKIVAAGDVRRLGLAQRDRFRRGFTVTSKAAPTVTGAATPGSTLTADSGRWNGGPNEFAHQWFRCDAAGACTPIAGAYSTSYTVAPEDVGATLKVKVAARNSVGMSTADSATTAPVA